MSKGLVCVFGADGFLGRYVVRRLAKDGWRIRACVRRPHIAGDLKVMGGVGQVQLLQANVRYKNSVQNAVQGCDAVINLAGLVFEQGRQKFGTVHELGAKNIADAAEKNGVTNFVHISAIGASQAANSKYARSKAGGERAVQNTVASADILRPSILFGEGDGFFTRFAGLAGITPILPLFGAGKTRFQPLYVDDLAQAICRIIGKGSTGKTWELAGPQTYTFKELLQFTLDCIGKKRLLVPLPWSISSLLGVFGDLSGYIPLVKPFLTRDQVQMLKTDSVVSGDFPGLSDLGIQGETISAIVPDSLTHFRKYGQFYQSPVN
ncbi:MAG: complex I NDUFA9 subunit family protein [Robiginitomaculum sp.]|nr:complex I NDUFA9 subunit family protein [Robiginitomaculum sp.]